MVRRMPARNAPDNGGVDRVPGGDSVDFGFRQIPAADKAGLVRGVFDSVAGRYDLMNDLMSGGAHRLWRAALVDWLNPRPGLELVDVAGGTGDIAFRVRDRVAARGDTCRITVCDLTPAMVEIGRDRAVDRGILDGIDWLAGDAEAMPLGDRTVDAYTIAFGLRNVTRLDVALEEARRVLRPGGRFLCLELSHVVLPLLKPLYDRYSFAVLPMLGQAVTGDREAYQYLVESIRRFPDQAALADRLTAAGFGRVRVRNLFGGVAALHSAWRL